MAPYSLDANARVAVDILCSPSNKPQPDPEGRCWVGTPLPLPGDVYCPLVEHSSYNFTSCYDRLPFVCRKRESWLRPVRSPG